MNRYRPSAKSAQARLHIRNFVTLKRFSLNRITRITTRFATKAAQPTMKHSADNHAAPIKSSQGWKASDAGRQTTSCRGGPVWTLALVLLTCGITVGTVTASVKIPVGQPWLDFVEAVVWLVGEVVPGRKSLSANPPSTPPGVVLSPRLTLPQPSSSVVVIVGAIVELGALVLVSDDVDDAGVEWVTHGKNVAMVVTMLVVIESRVKGLCGTRETGALAWSRL